MAHQPRIYLKEWRQYMSLTQRELIERSGVSNGTVSKAENQHYGVFPGTRRKLAEALGIEPHELLGPPPVMGRGMAASMKPEDGTED